MNRIKKILKCFMVFLLVAVQYAQAINVQQNSSNISMPFNFFGLASIYNQTHFYLVSPEGVERLTSEQAYSLQDAQWLVRMNRNSVAVLQHPELKFQLSNAPEQTILADEDLSWIYTTRSHAFEIAPELDQLRYTHLWAALAYLSRLIEYILIVINALHPLGWGISIVLLAILFKILLLPNSLYLQKVQNSVAMTQKKLQPELLKIKATMKGQEAHEAYMKAHKDLGVSAFYSLKPLFFTFIPVPFLVAIFNVLGEMEQLQGHSFLWINDLSLPDSIVGLGFTIPMLGDTLNLLPIVMTIFTIIAAIKFKNNYLTDDQIKKQKRNLYAMAFVFLILFYPFPAAMVLYWTIANILQVIQQKVLSHGK